MNAGRLRDMVRFDIRIIEVVDGQNVPRWVEDFHEPAEAIRTTETNARFVIRYNHRGISAASHRIIWDGAIYDITSALADQKRTEIVIECDFSQMIEVTHLESVDREFIEGLPRVRTAE